MFAAPPKMSPSKYSAQECSVKKALAPAFLTPKEIELPEGGFADLHVPEISIGVVANAGIDNIARETINKPKVKTINALFFILFSPPLSVVLVE
jgi:hypothetical protein